MTEVDESEFFVPEYSWLTEWNRWLIFLPLSRNICPFNLVDNEQEIFTSSSGLVAWQVDLFPTPRESMPNVFCPYAVRLDSWPYCIMQVANLNFQMSQKTHIFIKLIYTTSIACITYLILSNLIRFCLTEEQRNA